MLIIVLSLAVLYVHIYIIYVLVISCPGVLQQKYSADLLRAKPKVISTVFLCCITPGQDINNYEQSEFSISVTLAEWI